MLQINLKGQHLISPDKITKSDMHYDDIKGFYAVKQAQTLRIK